jgi:lactam utilization protein B
LNRAASSVGAFIRRCCNSPVSQPSASEVIPLNPDQRQQVLLPDCTRCTQNDCFAHPTFQTNEGVSDVARRPPNYDAFQRVAVEVFKTRNLGAIQSLKKFLTALPSPSYIKEALLQSIYQLAEQEPEAARWVLHHRQHLEPELNLTQVAQQIATERLQSQGLILNQDFNFTANGKLEASEPTKAVVLDDVSVGDRLLLEETLFIR